ncbi:MAG: EF-P beta-lysylation protein EpmB [Gammaproteobacteria bacterium]|nr:EF-P beta-lysylation protein EpmB [Gammaproteobacteria bacterium]
MGISSWQTDLQSSIHQYEDLRDACDLNSDVSNAPQSDFPVKVPRAFLSRINPNDPADPLLLQILPTLGEEQDDPGYHIDAVGEFNKHLTPGLIKKYHGRALLITTASCAIHCRYCFRRHYPYPENHASQANWAKAITTLQADTSISEIILSGGDPLSLTDAKLEKLIGQLENIEHLKFLRIHSRFPVVVPSRVTRQLLEILRRSRFKTTMVVHINHANEIDKAAGKALNDMYSSGMQLLNQSVLLKGVNDKVEVLTQLSEDLYSNHVLPYYLHLLDPVQGAAHFDVDEESAKALINSIRARLPGYLVPRLVKEIPDAAYKIPII